MKSVAIISTLDTKSAETAFVKELIERQGLNVTVIDVSLGNPNQEISLLGGSSSPKVAKLMERDREGAIDVVVEGASKKLTELLDAKKLDGVLGIGGATGTTIATRVMNVAPFGIPKLMLSSAASMSNYITEWVGTKDVAMLNSVLDIGGGVNPLIEPQLINAAGAIAGMVRITEGAALSKITPRMVPVTALGIAGKFPDNVMNVLLEKGYTPIRIHAQGHGDCAMEDLIGQGFFNSVCDIVPATIADLVLGGNLSPISPTRLEAAGKRGIPVVTTTCGLDRVSFGPLDRARQRFPDRKMWIQDQHRVQVKVSCSEGEAIATTFIKKLNQSKGRVTILIPLKGFTSASEEGEPLYDPRVDAAIINTIEAKRESRIKIEELPLGLQDYAFAEAVVGALEELVRPH